MDKVTLAIAKKYTDDTILGGGGIKGKNCTIYGIQDILGGKRVTFQWTLDDGTLRQQTMDVMNGADGQNGVDGAKGDKGAKGLGIKSAIVDTNNHLIITYDDNSTEDAGEINLSTISDKLEILDAPTTDGIYSLKVTVTNGIPTYSWVEE